MADAILTWANFGDTNHNTGVELCVLKLELLNAAKSGGLSGRRPEVMRVRGYYAAVKSLRDMPD